MRVLFGIGDDAALTSWDVLSNSYADTCVLSSLYHFYDGLWYDLAES